MLTINSGVECRVGGIELGSFIDAETTNDEVVELFTRASGEMPGATISLSIEGVGSLIATLQYLKAELESNKLYFDLNQQENLNNS